MSLAPKNSDLVLFVDHVNGEGNSVAASSSSRSMAVSFSLISSRDISIKVKEVRVSSVLVLSLHCSSLPPILEIVRYMVSFTLRSPRGETCVIQVLSSLSHALIISSNLSR